MNPTNKKHYIGVLIIALMLVFAIVLSACDGPVSPPPGDGGGSASQETDDSGDNPADLPSLNVVYDENAMFKPRDLDGLTVQYKDASGNKQTVDYTIVSADVSADGKYIETVISAAGLQQTFLLPYAGEDPKIREDLIPLYRTLTDYGEDKFFSLSGTFSTRAGEQGSEHRIALKAAVNVFKDKGLQFALINEGFESPETLFAFKEDDLSLDDIFNKADALFGMLSPLMALLPFSNPEPEPESMGIIDTVTGAIGDLIGLPGGAQNPAPSVTDTSRDAVTSLFVDLSTGLDAIDTVFDNPLVKLLNISFTADNGSYTLSVDSKKLIKLIEVFVEEDEENFDLIDVIDALDTQLDGALRSGQIKFLVKIDVKKEKLSFETQITNESTGRVTKLSSALEISETAFKLPEALTVEKNDEEIKKDIEALNIELITPISFPKRNRTLMLKTIVPISAIISGTTKDYILLDVFYNDQSAELLHFVLNESYVYLDASGFAKVMGVENASYYYAFEVNGRPATLIELITSGFNFGMGGESGEEPGQQNSEGETDPWNNPDNPFRNGYSYTINGEYTSEVILPIGTTEAAFKNMFKLYVSDDELNDVEYNGYTIRGFDSSTSQNKTITIENETWDWSCDISAVFYNPAAKRETVVFPDKDILVRKGSSKTEIDESVGAEIFFTDDVTDWSVYEFGFTISSVDGTPVDDNYVFNTAGDHPISILRTSSGETYQTSVHVFDPENLVATELICSQGSIWLDAAVTEAELREELDVYVLYDDMSSAPVSSYAIVGFEYGDDTLIISYGDWFCEVDVIYGDGQHGEPDSSPLSFVNYLRFEVEEGAEGYDRFLAIATKLKEIYADNKDLFKEVVSFEIANGGIRVNVTVNSDDDKDLLALLNLFMGIPAEDGWDDIDEEAITAIASGGNGVMVTTILEQLMGASFEDFIKQLNASFNLSLNDGISFGVKLDNGGETTYLTIDTGVHVTMTTSHAAPTAEEIEKADSFDNVSGLAFGFLLYLMTA